MKKLHIIKPIMIVAIVLLSLFQGYWLLKLYKDEYLNLKKSTDVLFRETLYKLQRQRFEKDSQLTIRSNYTSILRSTNKPIAFSSEKNSDKKFTFSTVALQKRNDSLLIQNKTVTDTIGQKFNVPPPEMLEVMMRLKQNMNDTNTMLIRLDTFSNKSIFFSQLANKPISIIVRKKIIDSSNNVKIDSGKSGFIQFSKSIVTTLDSLKPNVFSKPIVVASSNKNNSSPPIFKYFETNTTLNDSIPIKTVDSAFKLELQKLKYTVPCTLLFKVCDSLATVKPIAAKDTGNNFITSTVYLGFNTPFAYNAQFSKVPFFILQKMQLQIAGSLLLIGIVVFAFIAMYKTLLEQQKLAIIKNEFISNITHELKTPIATVNVAIEALRNFNAINNPEKTKEYLNISASELNRLSLLVDNVLKLSMFENKAIVLNKEWVNIEPLIKEVLNSLQLQFEKKKANIQFNETNSIEPIFADKLHLTSVLYNLIDNALKYSTKNIEIQISLATEHNGISIQITDNGLGIPLAYQQKIFDKFFRVPTNDRHNIKGYGLGLSYVAHIVNMHNGSIQVQSQEQNGSTFIVKLPKQ